MTAIPKVSIDGTPVPFTKATEQLKKIMAVYDKYLPKWSFPFFPLTVGALFQVFAWTSGSRLLGAYSLLPRILILWLFAGGEYLFMSTAMQAGIETRGLSEPIMVVVYQVITLVVFMLVNLFVYGNPFKPKYLVSFVLLAAAVYIAYM